MVGGSGRRASVSMVSRSNEPGETSRAASLRPEQVSKTNPRAVGFSESGRRGRGDIILSIEASNFKWRPRYCGAKRQNSAWISANRCGIPLADLVQKHRQAVAIGRHRAIARRTDLGRFGQAPRVEPIDGRRLEHLAAPYREMPPGLHGLPPSPDRSHAGRRSLHGSNPIADLCPPAVGPTGP